MNFWETPAQRSALISLSNLRKTYQKHFPSQTKEHLHCAAGRFQQTENRLGFNQCSRCYNVLGSLSWTQVANTSHPAATTMWKGVSCSKFNFFPLCKDGGRCVLWGHMRLGLIVQVTIEFLLAVQELGGYDPGYSLKELRLYSILATGVVGAMLKPLHWAKHDNTSSDYHSPNCVHKHATEPASLAPESSPIAQTTGDSFTLSATGFNVIWMWGNWTSPEWHQLPTTSIWSRSAGNPPSILDDHIPSNSYGCLCDRNSHLSVDEPLSDELKSMIIFAACDRANDLF